MAHSYKTMQTPVGSLKLVAGDKGLAGVLWENDKTWRVPNLRDAVQDNTHPVLIEAQRQLAEYFAGSRDTFDLPLDFTGNALIKKFGRPS